jgi:hypothetical protein
MKKLFCAIILSLTLGVPAWATPMRLQLINGSSVVNIFDGGSNDGNSTAGAVTYTGNIGAWDINVTTALGSNVLSPIGHMDLTSININNTGVGNPGTLIIRFTELNINTPYTAFDLRVGGTNRRTTMAYSAYYDNTNLYSTTSTGAVQAGSAATLIGTLGAYSTPTFSGSMTGLAQTDSLYSLTQVLTVTAFSPFPGNSFGADAELIPTLPEATTLVLLGSGLLATTFFRRKK